MSSATNTWENIWVSRLKPDLKESCCDPDVNGLLDEHYRTRALFIFALQHTYNWIPKGERQNCIFSFSKQDRRSMNTPPPPSCSLQHKPAQSESCWIRVHPFPLPLKSSGVPSQPQYRCGDGTKGQSQGVGGRGGGGITHYCSSALSFSNFLLDLFYSFKRDFLKLFMICFYLILFISPIKHLTLQVWGSINKLPLPLRLKPSHKSLWHKLLQR